jgi:hypothetical protein
VKCGAGSSIVPLLFAHSLREVNPHLASCIEIASWPHDRSDLQHALLESADCVTATGSDDAVAAIREQVPVSRRFVGYGHKVSFAYLTAEALSPEQLDSLVKDVATDVCAWNQLGCLSPQVVYVEGGGQVTAEIFAGRLAAALADAEDLRPRGRIPKADAASIRSRRSFYEVRAANLADTRLWHSKDSTAWTVICDADPRFQPSCLNRFVHVKGVGNLEAVLQGADMVRRHVSSVALAGPATRTSELAAQLADWGVPRVCPVGRMQTPPPAWRHDGRPVLNDLVHWTDWEE